ncbi:ATP-binding protein [Streptomyces sp. NPDC058301]|uniref:ATP-binding protein n=1 Tax=Streptomyces sp. NPDC058301 TaxID=3346436 RepID=UPI0036F16D58
MSSNEAVRSPLRCVLPFEAAAPELCLLRRAVRTQLGLWGLGAVTDEAQLAVSELASNVIKHVGEGVAATLVLEAAADRLRIELHDKSHAVPTRTQAACDAECGRGLHLLAGLAMDWGTVLTATGKAVWCELSLEPAPQCRRVQRAAALLEQYRRTAVRSSAALEEAATDLIADVLHLLAAQGRDPDDLLDRAQMHFEAEAA